MEPRRAPGSPARTKDQWSLLRWNRSPYAGTPARRAASSSDCCTGSESSADPTGTEPPTPTRSRDTIPRSARRSAGVMAATYAREP